VRAAVITSPGEVEVTAVPDPTPGPRDVVVGVAGVQRLGHREVDHGIAEELEPLVVPGRLAGMLMEPGGVGQRLGQQAPVSNGETELLGEEVGPTHDPVW